MFDGGDNRGSLVVREWTGRLALLHRIARIRVEVVIYQDLAESVIGGERIVELNQLPCHSGIDRSPRKHVPLL